MPPAAPRPLTDRQRAVMERIDRRVPIKVIALEIGVSETRINQHIRALKDIYEAASLGELVERYRTSLPPEEEESEDEAPSVFQGFHVETKGLSEPVYSKKQVPFDEGAINNGFRVDQGELVMNDVMPLLEQAPWLRPGEPKVVPRMLDGEHAIVLRFAAIVGIGFGLLAAIVLTLTAGITISEALAGRAEIRMDENGYSDRAGGGTGE